MFVAGTTKNEPIGNRAFAKMTDDLRQLTRLWKRPLLAGIFGVRIMRRPVRLLHAVRQGLKKILPRFERRCRLGDTLDLKRNMEFSVQRECRKGLPDLRFGCSGDQKMNMEAGAFGDIRAMNEDRIDGTDHQQLAAGMTPQPLPQILHDAA